MGAKYKESIVRDLLTELLIEKGFKRIRSNWRRETDTTYQLANIQRSSYGPYFYLNFAIFFKDVEPDVIPHRTFGHIDFRAGDEDYDSTQRRHSSHKEMVSKILDEEEPFTAESRRKFIHEQLWPKVDSVFVRFATLDAACAYAQLPYEQQYIPHANGVLLEYCTRTNQSAK